MYVKKGVRKMYDIKKWRHIFNFNPAKHISDDDLDAICMSQTDAIMIGGTDDVTEDNVIRLMTDKKIPLPLVLEISNIESVMPGFDFYFVPTVLNSTDVAFHNGTLLREALKTYGHSIDFEEVIFEGYVVCNADSKVAKVAKENKIP